jgi:hypothetical protein
MLRALLPAILSLTTCAYAAWVGCREWSWARALDAALVSWRQSGDAHTPCRVENPTRARAVRARVAHLSLHEHELLLSDPTNEAAFLCLGPEREVVCLDCMREGAIDERALQ